MFAVQGTSPDVVGAVSTLGGGRRGGAGQQEMAHRAPLR